ncbi:hypothetical protein BC940DRAFT_296440 [Gongronella butleri]|nr:hypothetical protein BC940DRAFT_296440 [Gongronella butleri]
MGDKKLTKKEKKAQAFRDKKKNLITEENAVPESDLVPETKKVEEKVGKKRSAEAIKVDVPQQPDDEGQEAKPKQKRRRGTRGKAASQPQEGQRFIVFVGNLPYDTTVDELVTHFGSVGNNVSARLMTDKVTKKPKGFAFVELATAADMQKALAFHRTTFKKRQINVELTAGGGGRSDARKEKIKTKNDKLTQERQKKSTR